MSIFPTRILLATDGSENVSPATDVAIQLSKVTDSELHITYVGEDAYSATLIYPETTDPGGVEREDPVLLEQLQRQFEQMSRRVLETEAEKVREAGGGHPDTPEGGKGGRGDSRAGGGAGRRTRGGGQPRFGRDQEGSDGQCLRFGRPSCPLPCPSCAQGRRVGVAACSMSPRWRCPEAPDQSKRTRLRLSIKRVPSLSLPGSTLLGRKFSDPLGQITVVNMPHTLRLLLSGGTP